LTSEFPNEQILLYYWLVTHMDVFDQMMLKCFGIVYNAIVS